MRGLLLLIILSGCAASEPLRCSAEFQTEKDVLGNYKENKKCSCSCPNKSSSVVDALGVVGGVLNLENSATK